MVLQARFTSIMHVLAREVGICCDALLPYEKRPTGISETSCAGTETPEDKAAVTGWALRSREGLGAEPLKQIIIPIFLMSSSLDCSPLQMMCLCSAHKRDSSVQPLRRVFGLQRQTST